MEREEENNAAALLFLSCMESKLRSVLPPTAAAVSEPSPSMATSTATELAPRFFSMAFCSAPAGRVAEPTPPPTASGWSTRRHNEIGETNIVERSPTSAFSRGEKERKRHHTCSLSEPEGDV